MKVFKNILFLTCMLFIMATFSQCGVTKLETKAPVTLGAVYYQHWTDKVEGGESGIAIVIPVISNPKNIVLDSVQFLGKQAKLEFKNNSVFIGHIKQETIQKEDIIMSSDPRAEYGNKVPKRTNTAQFQLQTDQCVVSYKIGNKVKYFKIDKILKKDDMLYIDSDSKKP